METKRIFNLTQANLFIQHGCQVVGVELGNRNKVCLVFLKDETFHRLQTQWDNRLFLKKD